MAVFFVFVCLYFWIIREIADGLNLDKKKKDKHVNENVGLKVVMLSLYCLIPVVLESGVNHYVHIQI